MRFGSLALTVLLCAALPFAARADTLYDGAGGQTPDQAPWNWVFSQSPTTPSVKGTASGGVTTLDTSSSNSFKAGYVRSTPAPLDNVTGYDVTFDLQTVFESHANDNRAGCSVIVLGSDHRGVELAFWTNEVWAQTDLFTHSTGTESQAFDTTAGLVHYDLHVANNAYVLTGNDAPLLTGSLHSYSVGPSIPYAQSNFLFVGDDTTSASATFRLARVTAAVPEPGEMRLLAGLSLMGLLTLRRRRSQTV